MEASETETNAETGEPTEAHSFLRESTSGAPTAVVGEPDPPRYEDAILTTPEDFEPAESSTHEVPLEESRKDETTVLATDIFDSDGNRVR